MANKAFFKSYRGKLIAPANAVNHHGAPAYTFAPRYALAQVAVTGSANGTFYADAQEQVKEVLALCEGLDAKYVAKTAIFARALGYMKDMPALLCAVLAKKDAALFKVVFEQIVDNGKMLRNVVQIVRSGITGRKSLGSVPKHAVQNWLARQTDDQLFKATVGQDPSMVDVIKMVHPKPDTASRAALYAYLLGRNFDAAQLPPLVKQFEEYKAQPKGEVPDVPFQMLTALNLGVKEWTQIARNAKWQMTRMNLNTFARHGVFEDKHLVRTIAARLQDEEAIRKARAFPYQLMAAYVNAGKEVPAEVKQALERAMEIAIRNVPRIEGQVYVCPDVSGSMSSPVTGFRQGSTTSVRCIEVAALVAAAIGRKNPSTRILPFENDVVDIKIDNRESVMKNAQRLASIGGGGTNCSAPLRRLNTEGAMGDLVVFVSDNESWVDSQRGHGATGVMQEWSKFKARNPKARLVCIDIQPYRTTQAAEREDILNIGGFSDQVFEVITEFARGTLNANHWVGEIEKISL